MLRGIEIEALVALERTRETIRDEEHWTQGVYARTFLQDPCSDQSVDAFSFCLVGAMRRATNDIDIQMTAYVEIGKTLDEMLPLDELGTAFRTEGFTSPVTVVEVFNDIFEHALVLEVVDLTIANMRKRTS